MRLDKFLANSGFGSRKEVKEAIKKRRVKLGDKVIKDSAFNVEENAPIFFDGKLVVYTPFIYLMLHKPAGYVSATFDKHLPTVLDLAPDKYKTYELFPVGRLDIDTEGFLLLTNDGDMAHFLLSPKWHVPKKYFVRCSGEITDEDGIAFLNGVQLDDGYKTLPASLEILSSNEAYLTIKEGKFHQVKRMFKTRSNEVIYLKRVSFAGLPLDPDLEMGKLRELKVNELEFLSKSIKK